jgi:hypothetical protein
MNGVGKVITMPVGFSAVTVEPALLMAMNDVLKIGVR